MKFDENRILVDLALQGGGSHGAFTWGVLDRLLEEPWLQNRRYFRYIRRRNERRDSWSMAYAKGRSRTDARKNT